MKKILALLLILVLSLSTMVGCDKIPGLDKIDLPFDIKLPWAQDDEVTAPTVEDAKNYLFSIYKDSTAAYSNDYDLVAKVKVDGVFFDVAWTVDTDLITIKESTKANFWTVDLPSKNDAEVAYVLTATISDAEGNKVELTFNKVLPVIDSTGITSTPVEGTAYRLLMNQVNLGQKLFALNTDEQDHKYIQTTNDATKAADFFVEKEGDGYKWYTVINDVKNYVYAQGVNNDGKISKYIGFSTENATVFNYVAETNSWQTTIDGTKYVVGTYNTYKTICISEATYITAENSGVSQFVVEFMDAKYANTLTPDAEPETITDSAKVIEALYALADGETKGGTFVVTGTITELDSYGNPTIVVAGLEDKPVLCYKLTDDQFVVGATITVSAKMLKNYKGTYELMECTLKNITLPGAEDNTPDGETVELTVDSLQIPDQTYHAGTVTVGGVTFELVQIGNYGDGIQVRDKNGNTSSFWNTVAFSAGIKEIILVYSDSKDVTHSNPDCEIFSFGNAAGTYTYETKLSTTEGVKTYTITPDVDTYTFLKFEHDLGYTMYWKSITIVLGEGSGTPSCQHTNTTENVVDATCGKDGSKTVVCADCGNTVSSEVLPATGEHTFVEGVCGVCGDKDPDYVDPNAPAFGIVDPVVGTAYKLGIINPTKDENVYYLSGGMAATYYLATSSDLAAALDVYLETADGGYYLYVVDNGAKLYINFTVSGTHVNSVYESAPVTVFTYNAELKTVVTLVNDLSYAIGTRNDKNYVTVGPVDVSRDPFICNFYGESQQAPTTCQHTNTTENVVEAVEGEDGSKTVVCADCGETLSTEVLHLIEQNIFWHPELVWATCVTPGVAVFECVNCDHYYTEATEIDPEGHDFLGGEYEIVTVANCATKTNGLMIRSCAYEGCDATQEVELDYNEFHEMVEQTNQPATCTTPGEYYAACANCDFVEEYHSEASGHSNWYLTCGDTGACMECGVEFTKEHALSAATCTNAPQCMNCWETFGEIDPDAHEYYEGVCLLCGAVEPTEHVCDFVAGEPVLPTCTEKGYTVYTCSDATCGKIETRDEVESLGHADENGDYKCDRCSTKMLPEDGTALTIPQALAIAKLHASGSYTTQKYYITGIVTNVYNTTYGNLYLKDADGNEICIYGLYSADGNTRYDKMSYKPVEGDELTVYTVLGMYSTTAQGKDAWMDEVVAHEHDYQSVVTDPTCIADGYTTHTCSICKASYTDSEVAALGHTTDAGVCENCGVEIGGSEPVIGTLAKFDFGANGSAAHVDGNDLGSSKSYTSGNYTLNLTMSKVYGPAYDAKGNSCIKLGTSKLVGSFSFTVADDVTEVVIYVAQYKSNSTKVNVNGTDYTISTASNNGEYTAITIDTTTNKTITFTTVASTYRCMIDAIEFKGNIA